MVEFETVESDEVSFGDDEFIQIGLKKAVSEDGEEEFIDLARGNYTEDGSKRVKNNFSIPLEEDVVSFLVEQLPQFMED